MSHLYTLYIHTVYHMNSTRRIWRPSRIILLPFWIPRCEGHHRRGRRVPRGAAGGPGALGAEAAAGRADGWGAAGAADGARSDGGRSG